METLYFRICVFLGLLAGAVIVALPLRRQFADFHEFVRRTPKWQRAFLALLAAVFIAYGSTKTNQVASGEAQSGEAVSRPLLMGMAPSYSSGQETGRASPIAGAIAPFAVTPAEIARGWQLVGVGTNAAVDYAMPEGAVLASNWWVRGAYEDVTRIELNPTETTNHQAPVTRHQTWRFPFGTNAYSSLWAFSWGKVRFRFDDTNEIAAVGSPMSAVPYRSRLWTLETNNAFLVTWEYFAQGRIRTGDLPQADRSPLPHSVNAQIELRRNGDFITRSNAVETAYRRVCPEDWDDDGAPNDNDANPYFRDGDFFGPRQTLPEGANSNAYCWVEIAADVNAHVVFTGDGESDLPDPDFMIRAGETNRVTLLIGKTYYVEGSQPVDVVAKSDERIEVSNVEPDSFTVVWPVEFTVAEGRAPESRPRLGATWNDGGKSFYVMPNPPWLRGEITWTDNYCCGVWGDGTNFTYACDNACTCNGCTVYGDYWYEGYGLPVWGISCGCHYVEDRGPTEMSLTFDKSAAIYEDDYTNRPGVVVHPMPSNVVLRCEVYGGTYGGRLTVTLNEAGHHKIARVSGNALPNNVLIQPDTTQVFETVYTPLEPSDSVNDIVAVATFVEDFTHDEYEPQVATLTSVKVGVYSAVEAVENRDRHRRTYGIAEWVNCYCVPAISGVSWSAVDAGAFIGGNLYSCPYYETDCRIRVTVGNADRDFMLSVIEPHGVICEEASQIDYSTPKGTAGCFGLELRGITLLPRTVSFCNIFVEEIPTDEGSRTGYFTNSFFADCWSHSYAQGAGIWIGVDGNNVLDTIDRATCGAVPPPWSNGGMVWPIPMGFHGEQAPLGTPPLGEIDANVASVYTVMSSGSVILSKLGHWASRSTNDVIVVDGAVVKGEE